LAAWRQTVVDASVTGSGGGDVSAPATVTFSYAGSTVVSSGRRSDAEVRERRPSLTPSAAAGGRHEGSEPEDEAERLVDGAQLARLEAPRRRAEPLRIDDGSSARRGRASRGRRV
jgi:hypothetical protein